MSELRIVTPQEAQDGLNGIVPLYRLSLTSLAYTVATEPERTRAAVVKALRDAAHRLAWLGQGVAARNLSDDADAIENGADHA